MSRLPGPELPGGRVSPCGKRGELPLELTGLSATTTRRGCSTSGSSRGTWRSGTSPLTPDSGKSSVMVPRGDEVGGGVAGLRPLILFWVVRPEVGPCGPSPADCVEEVPRGTRTAGWRTSSAGVRRSLPEDRGTRSHRTAARPGRGRARAGAAPDPAPVEVSETGRERTSLPTSVGGGGPCGPFPS